MTLAEEVRTRGEAELARLLGEAARGRPACRRRHRIRRQRAISISAASMRGSRCRDPLAGLRDRLACRAGARSGRGVHPACLASLRRADSPRKRARRTGSRRGSSAGAWCSTGSASLPPPRKSRSRIGPCAPRSRSRLDARGTAKSYQPAQDMSMPQLLQSTRSTGAGRDRPAPRRVPGGAFIGLGTGAARAFAGSPTAAP